MRWIAFLLLFATPAFGWETSYSGSVCLLTHTTDDAEVVVRHDPRAALPYAIQIRWTEAVWSAAPLFVMRFVGPAELTITSDRYQLSQDGMVLEVADKGFGNVLAGLALNDAAYAELGAQSLAFSLAGAREKVEAFKDCIDSPTV